jgi:hypothetical protein
VNGRTGTIASGPWSALVGGMPVVRPAPLASTEGSQRPGVHPWPLFSALGPVGALPTAPGLTRAFTAMTQSGWAWPG